MRQVSVNSQRLPLKFRTHRAAVDPPEIGGQRSRPPLGQSTLMATGCSLPSLFRPSRAEFGLGSASRPLLAAFADNSLGRPRQIRRSCKQARTALAADIGKLTEAVGFAAE